MLRLPALPVLLIIYSVVGKHSAEPSEEQKVAIVAILKLGGIVRTAVVSMYLEGPK